MKKKIEIPLLISILIIENQQDRDYFVLKNIGRKMSKEQKKKFHNEYLKFYLLEALLMECFKEGLDDLDWDYLHKNGLCCLKDYEYFEPLFKYKEEAQKLHDKFRISRQEIYEK